MGSSYSDLNLYFKIKDDTYGIPKNGQPKDQNPKNEENHKYFVTVKEENYDKCVNFEKVTHSITFGKKVDPLYYNVLLYDGDYKDNGKSKGKNIFGYYYPNNNNEVLKELHVYYSVIDPNIPLVVSFVTRGGQTHNFLYSGLLSTGWVRAYSIAYYSLGQTLSTDHLTNEFRKSHRNRKIEFVIGENVVDVYGYKQDLDNGSCYRYIYFPSGDKSVLGSECLCKLDSKTPTEFKCPEKNKSPETANSKPAESPKPAAETQTNSPHKYNNKIDPYYLDFVNGHYYDGVILYFVKENKNQGQKPASEGSGSNGNSENGEAKKEAQNDNYDHNMAVLLELIDNCNTKTHLKRNDKHGNNWSQEKIKYNDYKTLKEALENIKKTACENESTTFILENKDKYKGVSVTPGEVKTTYRKYEHKATTPIKTKLLFRKEVTEVGKYDPTNNKTISLDVYFLKFNNKEEDWPFIIMFTYKNEDKAAKPGAESGSAAPAVQPPQQPPAPTPAPAAPQAHVANGPKPCKRCFYSKENYMFNDWEELTIDKLKEAEPSEKEQKEKQTEKDQGEELQKKLEAKLTKIDEYGKCQTELYLLRKVAYYVLSTEEPKTEEIKEIEQEKRPEVQHFIQMGTGTSLKVVLGSVAGGLVVLGTISAIIYGIYWYNTTIKLLT